jgi:replication factor A1
MADEQTASFIKVKDLTPSSKQANLVAKVVNVGERRTVESRFGPARQLSEATIGDETGIVIMSLWEDQIDKVSQDDVIQVSNGYVSLVRGHIRLNVGKYGSFSKSDAQIGEVNTSNDVSAQEHERPQREYRGGGGGYGGGGYGGGGGGYRGGGDRYGGGGGGFGGRDRDRGGGRDRDRGRRRF